jgi:carboxypeptidase Q
MHPLLTHARPRILCALVLSLLAVPGAAATGQTFRSDDSVLRRIWTEGMQRSQAERFAQVLMDSIGPRLSGTAGYGAAVEWLERTYASLSVTTRREQYGTWRGWRRGTLHVDLLAPWVTTLEARFAAWSPGTDGPVEGEVVVIPEGLTLQTVPAWLAGVRGKFVLVSAPRPGCRAPEDFAERARPETVAAERAEVERRLEVWMRQVAVLGGFRNLGQRLEAAGALGLFTHNWIGRNWEAGWGTSKIFDAGTATIPSAELSCEDYGLLARLAAHGQGPRVRVDARAESTDPVPMFNVIAELRGAELPDEYVVLSAHLDSEQGATGATDNGTGTIMMLEAMRLLKAAYPRPRRTILVGHWGGEEQGLIGSRAFTEDHPEVLEGLQAVFNQDNGTWRVEYVEANGFLEAAGSLARWLSLVPPEITQHLRLGTPGEQVNGGSDHASFVCHGAPAFRLQSDYDEYRQYTWHTNRDTFDKIVFDDLRNNATLVAMLAYAASEDPARTPRTRALLGADPETGQPREWPTCGKARRVYQP